jgi:hypothetical protein
LPKPQGEGAALSITGTDMSSINAGGHLTARKAMKTRASGRVGMRPDAPPAAKAHERSASLGYPVKMLA